MILVSGMEYQKLKHSAKTRNQKLWQWKADLRAKAERQNEKNHQQWLKSRAQADKLNRDLVKAGKLMRQRQAAMTNDVIVISSTDESD